MAQVEPWKPDWGDPVLALEIVRNEHGNGVVQHWPAFDPAYGPESQKQIDWHIKRGTPGAEHWEVGKPVKVKHTPGSK